MDERMESSVSRTILTQMLHENCFSHRLQVSKATLRAYLRSYDSKFDGLIWVLCLECCSPAHQSGKMIVGAVGMDIGRKGVVFAFGL